MNPRGHKVQRLPDTCEFFFLGVEYLRKQMFAETSRRDHEQKKEPEEPEESEEESEEAEESEEESEEELDEARQRALQELVSTESVLCDGGNEEVRA